MCDSQFRCFEKNMTYDALRAFYKRSGYWATEYLAQRNACVLSPCVYVVSSAQQVQLQELGKSVYANVQDIATRLATYAVHPPRSRDEQELLSIAHRNARQLVRPCDMRDASIPPVIKVDMVQDEGGNYFVAEADVYNPRGLGFNAFFEKQLMALLPDVSTHPFLEWMADQLHAFAPHGSMTMIVSDYERYYASSFMILADALAEKHFSLRVVYESHSIDLVAEISKTNGCAMILPESLSLPRVREALLRAHYAGDVQFFFPPKAFLGSKLLLPYMRNDFVPTTALVSKYHKSHNPDVTHGAWILKKGQSSGMKGVIFSDMDAGVFHREIAQQYLCKRPSWIVQKQVPQKPMRLRVYNVDGSLTEGNYYVRIIAQCCADGVIGLDITARTDRMVHGAPDCVMMPAILA